VHLKSKIDSEVHNNNVPTVKHYSKHLTRLEPKHLWKFEFCWHFTQMAEHMKLVSEKWLPWS